MAKRPRFIDEDYLDDDESPRKTVRLISVRSSEAPEAASSSSESSSSNNILETNPQTSYDADANEVDMGASGDGPYIVPFEEDDFLAINLRGAPNITTASSEQWINYLFSIDAHNIVDMEENSTEENNARNATSAAIVNLGQEEPRAAVVQIPKKKDVCEYRIQEILKSKGIILLVVFFKGLLLAMLTAMFLSNLMETN